MRRSRAGGFSLPEVIVASVVLLALLTGLYLVTTSGLRYFQYNRVHSETLLEASKALARMEEDLAGSAKVSIGTGQNPVPYVWMLSAEGFDQQPFHYGDVGQLYWRKRICYFLDGRALIRAQIHLTTPTEQSNPPPAPVPELSDFQAVTDHRERVAGDIEGFTVVPDPALSAVTVSMVSSQEVASDKSTQIKLQTTVKVENQ